MVRDLILRLRWKTIAAIAGVVCSLAAGVYGAVWRLSADRAGVDAALKDHAARIESVECDVHEGQATDSEHDKAIAEMRGAFGRIDRNVERILDRLERDK